MITKEIGRFITFALIGLFNSFLDIFVFNILQKLFLKRGFRIDLKFVKLTNYSIAHFCSFLLASVSSFILNSFLTFSDSQTTNRTNQFFKFFGVTFFTGILTTFLMQFLTSPQIMKILENKIFILEKKIFKRDTSILKKYWHLFAKFITIIFGTFINFFGYKYLVF